MTTTLKLAFCALSFALLALACSASCDQAMPSNKALDFTNDQSVALDGNDVTAYFTQNKVVKGNASFQSTHKGITYHFASGGAKALFDTNPTKYLPQFGGFCAVAASFNKVEPIQLDLFDVYEGKVYFSRNEKAQRLWNEDKPGVKKRADMLWPCLVISNGRDL